MPCRTEHQSLQHQKLGIIVDEQGNRLVSENGDHFVVMHNGRRYQGTRGTAEFSTTKFEEYAIRVEAKEAKEEPPSTQSKSSLELMNSNNHINHAELQWRFAIPISALILSLLAIPLSAIDPRAGRTANFALALVIYIIYNNLLSIMQAWVAQGKVDSLIGLWPIHLLFLIITAFMFYRRAQQLPIIPEPISAFFSLSWLRHRHK